ncbi:Regulator of telomere elongation helicase 1-like protein [Diplonema papillatum]|nr:Regulator of telomere elongation helicase 1-like protein [Diplonema papillatum]
MPRYVINGSQIEFPHEAYSCQLDYMEKAIVAVADGKNALLESPTGTGKTLSLLCSIIGWLQAEKKRKEEQRRAGGSYNPDMPRVFYCSRTHAQLKQVIKEFRRTAYGKVGGDNEVTMTVMGSRDQLCVHPKMEGVTGAASTALCTSLRSQQKCRWYQSLDSFVERGGVQSINNPDDDPLGAKHGRTYLQDIEDLAKAGTTHGFCPFYYTRRAIERVSVVFAPYNYVIDPNIRKQLSLDLSNAIIIIDEAHNIANNTTDASSFSLNTVQIAEAVSEIDRAKMQAMKDDSLDTKEVTAKLGDYETLRTLIMKLITLAEETAVRTKGAPDVERGGGVLKLLETNLALTRDTYKAFAKIVDDAMASISKDAIEQGSRADAPGLEKLTQFLQGAFTHSKDVLDESFFLVIHREQRNEKKFAKHSVAPPIQIGLWCMEAGIAINSMMRTHAPPEEQVQKAVDGRVFAEGPPVPRKPRSLLITSGTLRPIDFFSAELNLGFDIKLQCPHIIAPTQILTMAITKAVNGVTLNSSSANRTNPNYLKGLGLTLVKLAHAVPDGMLVFFQSFTFMRDVLTAWKQPQSFDAGHTIYDVLTRQKTLLEEPSNTSQSHAKLKEYCELIDRGHPAFLFGVFRAKMAEGTDFPDRYARGVALVGIPYANWGDLKVQLKMRHLDEKRASKGGAKKAGSVSGGNWYTLDALRAINQAVGRVIRHGRDFGAVFFLDERYDSKGLQVQLPTWVGANMKSVRDFHSAATASIVEGEIATFFHSNGRQYTPLPTRRKTEHPQLVAANNGFSDLSDGQGLPAFGAKEGAGPRHDTASSFASARRYQETRRAQDAQVLLAPPDGKRQRLSDDPPESAARVFLSTEFAKPRDDASGKSLAAGVGAVPVKPQFTLQEYKTAVQRVLTPEQYSLWKGLLREFAAQIDDAGAFMRNRFVPWLVDAFPAAHHDLLRSHVVTLPPSIRADFLAVLKTVVRQKKSRPTS